MVNNRLIASLIVAAATLVTSQALAAAISVDFEELSIAGGIDYYNGSDLAGGFESGGVAFNNRFEDFGNDCCWDGFAYSKSTNNSTGGTDSQYSSFAGSGAGGSDQYAVAFSGYDAGNGGLIPTIALPVGSQLQSVDVTNTTYAAIAMRDGTPFSFPFGGTSGNEPDWFLLRIEGRDVIGTLLGQVEFYLADYRFADNASDYLRDEWTTLDLSTLNHPALAELHVRVDSSDFDGNGLLTPAYVAIDNLVIDLPMSGDYNGDGMVSTADYTVWRDSLGAPAVPHGSGADGSSNGVVDAADYLVWKTEFDGFATIASSRTIVPEPGGYWPIALLMSGWILTHRTLKRGNE